MQYFEDWLASIEQRSGNFSRNAKGKMFISQQTYEAFKITVNSIIEAVRFLLQHEVSLGASQVPLGARKDNPSLRDFGFNENAIRNQKVFRQIAANVRGGQDQSNTEFSFESVPCRKKAKKD